MAHAGEFAALGTACCWTVTSLSFEAAGKRIGSLPVNLIRLVMAALLLSAYGLATRGLVLPTDASAHAWGWLALSGLVGFTFGDLCLFRAFVVLGARLSVLLMSLTPLFAAGLGLIFLGESLAPLALLGMAVTLGGVAWVVLERPADEPAEARRSRTWGILLGIGGALGQAGGLILSKHGMGDYDAFAATQIRVLAGLAGFAVLFLVLGLWPRVFAALRQGRALAYTGVGAFAGPFLGVSLSLIAVRNTHVGIAATLMSLMPVLILAPAVLLMRERVSWRAGLGAVGAVGGAAILFLA
jgi:drug/metabolite transporter (DMT)-like permease